MLYSFFIRLTNGELMLFSVTLGNFLEGNADRLRIPAEAVTGLGGVIDVFKAKYRTVAESGNAGTADIAAQDDARTALVAALQDFIGSYIRPNKLWTIEDLANAGFPLSPSTGGFGQITESLVVSLSQKENAFILAHGQCKSIAGHGMAPFANLIFFVWDFKNADGTWPAADDCRYNLISFAAAATIEVSPKEKTREITVYGRYHNHFPKPGPWSEGVTIVIA